MTYKIVDRRSSITSKRGMNGAILNEGINIRLWVSVLHLPTVQITFLLAIVSLNIAASVTSSLRLYVRVSEK